MTLEFRVYINTYLRDLGVPDVKRSITELILSKTIKTIKIMSKHITNNDKRVAHNKTELGIMFLETLLFSIWNETDKKANNDVQYSDEEKEVIVEQLLQSLVDN